MVALTRENVDLTLKLMEPMRWTIAEMRHFKNTGKLLVNREKFEDRLLKMCLALHTCEVEDLREAFEDFDRVVDEFICDVASYFDQEEGGNDRWDFINREISKTPVQYV